MNSGPATAECHPDLFPFRIVGRVNKRIKVGMQPSYFSLIFPSPDPVTEPMTATGKLQTF